MYEVAQDLGALGLSRMSVGGPSLIVTSTMSGAQSKLASQQIQDRAAADAAQEATAAARRAEAAEQERRRSSAEARRAAEEATAEQDAILERQRRRSNTIMLGVSLTGLTALGVGGFFVYRWWIARKRNN